MLCYKFRSASRIEYVIDIIVNKRLFCADWRTLNDPMEGVFFYPYNESAELKDQITQLIEDKSCLRVCSLTESYDNVLLWAYYASGFKGLAIEIDLPDEPEVVNRIQYNDEFKGTTNSDQFNMTAKELLLCKYKSFEHEKEIRILHTSTHYDIKGKVKKIILGHLMEETTAQLLQIISKKFKISIVKTNIKFNNISNSFSTISDTGITVHINIL